MRLKKRSASRSRSCTAIPAGNCGQGGCAAQQAAGRIGADVGEGIVRGTLTGLTSGGVQSLISHQRPNWGLIAAESFGQSLGDSLVSAAVSADNEQPALAEELQQRLQEPVDLGDYDPSFARGQDVTALTDQANRQMLLADLEDDSRNLFVKPTLPDFDVAAAPVDFGDATLTVDSRQSAERELVAASRQQASNDDLMLDTPVAQPAHQPAAFSLSQQVDAAFDAYSVFPRASYDGNVLHDSVAQLYNLGSTAANLPFVAMGVVGNGVSQLDDALGGALTASQFSPEIRMLEGMAAVPGLVRSGIEAVEEVTNSALRPNWENVVSGVDGDFGYLPTLRQQYVNKVDNLKLTVDNMLQSGTPIEDVGRYAYAARNDIKLWAREYTPPEVLQTINARNLNKPGYDQFGPKLDYLLQKGKSWEQILESATRSGGGDLF